jgi:hypothetical protein
MHTPSTSFARNGDVHEYRPPSSAESVRWNFKLLAQHTLDGFGRMGEGMSIQMAHDAVSRLQRPPREEVT